MIFSTSLPHFKSFLGNFSAKATDRANCLLFVVAFLLPACRRSVAAAARGVLEDCRDAGWLLRWLGTSNAPAALLAAAQQQLRAAAREAAERLHLLVLDSTYHGGAGKHTENTIATGNKHQRPKKSDRRQNKHNRHSGHCFVVALLLTPCGLRIPYWLPFYTRAYCRLFSLKHLSQADLAAQLIDAIPLPEGRPVVVVGDTAFEAKQIRSACGRRNWQWVAPLNPERVLAGASPRPKVRSLYEQLQPSDFHRVTFRLDQGPLAEMARVSPSRVQSSKHQRTYWVHRRTAAVHNVGEVVLLFSRLTQPGPGVVTVQKVLMSDAVGARTEELLLWYSLRWQIEQFFREMKSELGMCQCKLGHFPRVAGWVNLAVVAFCYLEWTRRQQHEAATGKDKEFWQRLRTAGLKEKIRQQVQRAEIESVLRLAVTQEGQQCLQRLLDKMTDGVAAA